MRTFKEWINENADDGIVAYHATRSEPFDKFDLRHATDELGVQLGEGYGPNKFYFAKERNLIPQMRGSGTLHIATVRLSLSKTYDGRLYRDGLRRLRSKVKTNKTAFRKMDEQVLEEGYDSIEDSWQYAVYYPDRIEIVSWDKI